jgi:hypothetical protein
MVAENEKSRAMGIQVLAQNLMILSFIDQEIATEVKMELAKKYVTANAAAARMISGVLSLPCLISSKAEP